MLALLWILPLAIHLIIGGAIALELFESGEPLWLCGLVFLVGLPGLLVAVIACEVADRARRSLTRRRAAMGKP